MQGLGSKNNRTKIECCEEIGCMIQREGMGPLLSCKVKPLPALAQVRPFDALLSRNAARQAMGLDFTVCIMAWRIAPHSGAQQLSVGRASCCNPLPSRNYQAPLTLGSVPVALRCSCCRRGMAPLGLLHLPPSSLSGVRREIMCGSCWAGVFAVAGCTAWC